MIVYEDLKKLNARWEAGYKDCLNKVLDRGWYILGEEVTAFQNEFAHWNNNSKYCIGVANGLDALILALRALELPKGSEVIVPSNTYIATILSILHNDLIPVLAEPDIATYNLNAKSIENCITAKTRAILVVHLYGKCCPMDEILTIANQRGIAVVEDCAQSHGAKYKGELCGNFGAVSGFSFYPTKNLGSLGDAGVVITNDDKIYETVRQLRNYGSDVKYHNERVGFNSRLDELQAAFLRIKLKELDMIIKHKRKLASIYFEDLREDFVKPQQHEDFFDVFHIFNVRHQERDKLKEHLKKNNIGTEIHYPVPPHKQKALTEIFKGQIFPVSEAIHSTTLSLPCSFCHTEDEIHQVVKVMNKF
jgi:dTDP-4-amino-4,6-dideoxygalactose transaminase